MYKCFWSHNPYFNRWFSAIGDNYEYTIKWKTSHNPYFNRWFSAISKANEISYKVEVTILILIDGFLQ